MMKPKEGGLHRIEHLLAQPILLREERRELYDLAERYGTDVRRKRFVRLMGQPALFDDDREELLRLSAELQIPVTLERVELG